MRGPPGGRYSPAMSRLRAAARASAFASYTAVSLARWELKARSLEPGAAESHRRVYLQRFTRGVLKVFGVDLIVEPGWPAPADRARLVVANHQSALDVGVTLAAFGGSCLSRADIADWPLFGRAAREARTIFVDRDDGQSGARAIRAMRTRLREGGTVVAFPEGRTHLGDALTEFRPGAFVAARGLDVEIVPMGIVYTPGVEYVDMRFSEHLAKVASIRATRCYAKVGPPLAHASTRELAAEAQRRVQALVHDARDRLDALGGPA